MPLTSAVDEIYPHVADKFLKVVGEGVFNWSVFRFYRAKLLNNSGVFDAAEQYALEIVYLRKITAEQIAHATASEIQRLGQLGVTACAAITPEQVLEWQMRLKQILHDVTLGDRLLGVFKPQQGVWFYDTQTCLGQIQDPAFVAAFTAIWLDPQTRAKTLRTQLLGSSEAGLTQTISTVSS